jgi:hypothetical protein
MRTMRAEGWHGGVAPKAIGPAPLAARRFRAT